MAEYKVVGSQYGPIIPKKKRIGRGLICLEEKTEVMLLKLYDYLHGKSKTRVVAEMEREKASHLGLIRDHLQRKYGLCEEDVKERTIRKKQEEHRMERIKGKKMHSLLFNEEDMMWRRLRCGSCQGEHDATTRGNADKTAGPKSLFWRLRS